MKKLLLVCLFMLCPMVVASAQQKVTITNTGNQVIYLAYVSEKEVWGGPGPSGNYSGSSSGTTHTKTVGWWNIQPGTEHVIWRWPEAGKGGNSETIYLHLERVDRSEVTYNGLSSKQFCYHPNRFEHNPSFGGSFSYNGSSFSYLDDGVTKRIMPKDENQAINQGWKQGRFYEVPKGNQQFNVR